MPSRTKSPTVSPPSLADTWRMGELAIQLHNQTDHVGTVEGEGEQGSVQHRRLHQVEGGEGGVGLPLLDLRR